jgi:hypothetical protein
MLEVLTGRGLAVAAGLNAYIPLLILGLAGRILDFVELPSRWAWLKNPWVLGILGVLLVIEIIADKMPVAHSINDWLRSVVRPAAGGIAFDTHATKMLARPAPNAATAGTAAPVVSAVEDISSALLSFMALFVPIIGFLALLGLFTVVVVKARRSRRARLARQ